MTNNDDSEETRRKKEIYRRVDEAFLSKGIKTQRERAAICGVKQETVSKWKRGINAPYTLNMLDISLATGYEAHWMYTEKGRKFCPPDDPIGEKFIRLLNSADAVDQESIYRLALAYMNKTEDDDGNLQ